MRVRIEKFQVDHHSRPQSLRFFWSRGRRNGGLRSQPLPDVRKSRTSGNACVILARVSAHAQKLIPREGREEQIVSLSVNRSDFQEALTVFSSLKLWSVMWFRVKREQKTDLDAFAASNTIASLSSILPTGFVVQFCGGRSIAYSFQTKVIRIQWILRVILLSMTR